MEEQSSSAHARAAETAQQVLMNNMDVMLVLYLQKNTKFIDMLVLARMINEVFFRWYYKEGLKSPHGLDEDEWVSITRKVITETVQQEFEWGGGGLTANV